MVDLTKESEEFGGVPFFSGGRTHESLTQVNKFGAHHELSWSLYCGNLKSLVNNISFSSIKVVGFCFYIYEE